MNIKLSNFKTSVLPTTPSVATLPERNSSLSILSPKNEHHPHALACKNSIETACIKHVLSSNKTKKQSISNSKSREKTMVCAEICAFQ